MRNDELYYCFNIYCPDSLLWWLLIVCFLGTIITGAMMQQINHFITDEAGNELSLIKLERMSSPIKLHAYLSQFTGKSLDMVRRNLQIDFAFMPFIYLTMFSISALSLRHLALPAWERALHYLCWMPFMVWVLDILENMFAFSVLNAYQEARQEVTSAGTALMAVASWLKWMTGLLWLVGMVSLLLGYLVQK